jgi:hypothetical protein
MASTDREIPKIMKKETMAVVEPARTKTWGGSQVWPPPSSSTTLPRLGSPVQSPGKDNKWEMIKDGVFAKNENYDKPVGTSQIFCTSSNCEHKSRNKQRKFFLDST